MVGTIEYGFTEIHRLRPDKRNPRTHSKTQVQQLADSMTATGFFNPILKNPSGIVIAGHGRLRAAKLLGMTSVPTITIAGLSDAEERRLRIADNKIALNAGWDTELLRIELSEIEIAGLDLSLSGFSVGEIDALRDGDLGIDTAAGPVAVEAVSHTGDIWLCGLHRIGCGDLLDGVSLTALMVAERADMIMTDPPYNTSNITHNGGNGRIQHREFA